MRDLKTIPCSLDTFTVSYKDIGLDGIRRLIKSYSDTYLNVVFVIHRRSGCYELSLKGDKLQEGGDPDSI